MNPPFKDAWIHTRLGLVKCRATQLKPEKIRIDELSYQPEKLCTEALLDVLSKAIAEEINTTLKNDCMACYDATGQVHFCYLNNPPGKVDRNLDNAFQLVDLWSANKMTFEKTKDKSLVAVKDKYLYLTRSDLLRNVILMDRLKPAVRNFVNTWVFSFNFFCLFIFVSRF